MRMNLTKLPIVLTCGLVALFVAVAFGQASSTSPVTGGSVSGTVTSDGQPVVNAKVSVFKAEHHKSAKSQETATSGNGTKPRREPLMVVNTDGDGHFSLTDLPAGEYTIVAKEKGDGHGRQKLSVIDGQSATVAITLAKKAGGKKGVPTTNP
jgi:uncharacterized GH25 family protein